MVKALVTLCNIFFFVPDLFAQALIPTLYIDPGHGGTAPGYPGAYIADYDEKDINLEVALMLKDNLDQLHYTSYMSRDTDIFISNLNRAQEAMDLEAGALISIHHNSDPDPSVQHTLALYSSFPYVQHDPFLTPRKITDRLAHKCALRIDQFFRHGLSNDSPRGLRDSDTLITVLVRTSMPSALTEASFISDSTEEEDFYYRLTFHQEKEAAAIANAFFSWTLGQGFGKVDYAYAGQTPIDSHKVRVHDYLNDEFSINDTTFAPYLGVWNLDYLILIQALNFNQNGYGYQFHH